MNRFFVFLSLVIFFLNSYASDHGIYLQTVSDIQGDVNEVSSALISALSSTEFKVVASLDIKTPDYVREDTSEYCGYSAQLLVLTSESYTKMITSYGLKYLIAGFLRIGIYETPGGIQVNLANPETINRIIFNDLEDESYAKIVKESQMIRKQLVDLAHSIGLGNNVETEMEPIRDDEDLREASRDMFMMVGPLTFFQDEDQFPLIYSTKAENGKADIQTVFAGMVDNLQKFDPDEDDVEYRWTPEKSDLNWKIVSDLYAPDSSALMLGITRPRTEGVSFYIAGKSREEDDNFCPGIDHVTAYPIEILIIHENENINVYSAREMFRMDMYFWDAGQWAFMDHMQMPGMLDDSIKRAFFGPEEE